MYVWSVFCFVFCNYVFQDSQFSSPPSSHSSWSGDRKNLVWSYFVWEFHINLLDFLSHSCSRSHQVCSPTIFWSIQGVAPHIPSASPPPPTPPSTPSAASRPVWLRDRRRRRRRTREGHQRNMVVTKRTKRRTIQKMRRRVMSMRLRPRKTSLPGRKDSTISITGADVKDVQPIPSASMRGLQYVGAPRFFFSRTDWGFSEGYCFMKTILFVSHHCPTKGLNTFCKPLLILENEITNMLLWFIETLNPLPGGTLFLLVYSVSNLAILLNMVREARTE